MVQRLRLATDDEEYASLSAFSPEDDRYDPEDDIVLPEGFGNASEVKKTSITFTKTFKFTKIDSQ